METKEMELKLGVVDDYFAKVGVIALKLEDEVKVGDTIHVKGHTTDFTQEVNSMQIEHVNVQKASKGDSIGIKVNERVRKGDIVYKVLP
ncbi:MAG: translation elongation factor-like protein [Elusimicrobiota bacterium]|nr:translation elongation factor-like protein [Elusimicrobiota bacterium]